MPKAIASIPIGMVPEPFGEGLLIAVHPETHHGPLISAVSASGADTGFTLDAASALELIVQLARAVDTLQAEGTPLSDAVEAVLSQGRP